MIEENWVIRALRADFDSLSEKFGISPVTARVIRNRGLVTDEEFRKYLHGTLNDLWPASLLAGAEEAAGLLKRKIDEKKKIRVIGD